MRHIYRSKALTLLVAVAALLACSSHGEPSLLYQALFTDCGQGGAAAGSSGAAGADAGSPGAGMGGMAAGAAGAAGTGGSVVAFEPVAPGAITGFGFDGQPRQWGTDGTAVKAALDLLVTDLGANFARVEVNDGETTWEATNDDADPATFNWSYYDDVFSQPVFEHLWAYVRYLNQLGVKNVELADHGGLPGWFGGSTYNGDGRSYSLPTAMEDEWVETSVAMLEYARTRTALPHPDITLFSPFNEPEFSPPEGFTIDPTTQGKRIIRKLVDRMNALPELDGIKLVISDSSSEAGMITLRQAVQSDSVVQARLAATSFHRYSDADVFGTWSASDVPPVWLTEFNSTWQASCYTTTWTMALQATGNLVSALQNGITAGLAWSDYDAPHIHQDNEWQTFGLLATHDGSLSESQLCGHYNNTQPADSVLDAMTYSPKPTYYALRHGFKWIKRGALPVTVSDSSSSVDLVAFKNPDASVAVFGRNTSPNTVSVNVTLSMSSPPAALTPRTSTSSTTDVVGSPVTLSSGSGAFTLPGASVFTLLSDASGGSGGMGGAGGMSGAGGSAGAAAGAPQGGQSGASAGGMSGSGGAAAGAGLGGQGSGGMAAGSGGQAMGGAGAGGTAGAAAGAAGSAGTGGSSGLPPLVAGWAFNEGSGTTAADASGNAHTGTLASGVTWVTSGCKFGGCLSFPGTSGKNVTVADANDLDLGTDFTITAWVLPTTTSGWRPVLIKENGTNKEAYLLYSNPSIQGAYFTDSGNTEWSVAPSGNVSTSTWTHVAMVKSGTSLSYWMGGTSLGSTTVSSSAVVSSTGILAIGGHTFWSGEWFSGKLDDIRIYKAALNTTQINVVMSSGL